MSGLVQRDLLYHWTDFRALPRVRVFADMHCVTRWSRLGNLWEGVAAREILRRAGPLPEARFVVVHGYDPGFTTNLPLEAFDSEDVLLADPTTGSRSLSSTAARFGSLSLAFTPGRARSG